MFDSSFLDVAISLVFIYFFLSLLCSVIIEGVAALIKKRPRMLCNAISSLLDASSLEKLYDQPLFVGAAPGGFWSSLGQTLWPRKKKRNPSYISSQSFVLSLLESLKQNPDVVKNMNAAKKSIPALDTVANIKELVGALPDDNKIKKALVPLLESAGNNLEKAFANMEKWYDEAMERVGGWYKRYSQAFAMILAILVSLGLNVDTFEISKAVYRNKSLRDSLVAMADDVRKNPPPLPSADDAKKGAEGKQKKQAEQSPSSITKTSKEGNQKAGTISPNTKKEKQGAKTISPPNDPKGKTEGVQQKQAKQTTSIDPKKSKEGKPETGTNSPNLDEKIKAATTYYEKLNAINLPMGWPLDKGGWPDRVKIFGNKEQPGLLNLWKILGILFTALLVSLGSNFWFELLNKLVNMRNAGKKPPTKEELDAQQRKAGP
jgi:hypothetical protein